MTITEKDPYDAFVYPDGFVMYRHEAEDGAQPLTPEQLEAAHIVVHPKGSAEWIHIVQPFTMKDRSK